MPQIFRYSVYLLTGTLGIILLCYPLLPNPDAYDRFGPHNQPIGKQLHLTIDNVIPPRHEHRVDCSAIINGNMREIDKASKLSLRLKSEEQQWAARRYIKLATNCSSFLNRRGYIMSPLTREEMEFPIAFGILVAEDVEMAERLLRAIYRPQNYYCIHVDSKYEDIYRVFLAIASCLNNVILPDRRLNVGWGTFSTLEAELICMETLLTFTRWKYFINLTGKEFPLKTNADLVQILRSFNGDAESDEMRKPHISRYKVWNTSESYFCAARRWERYICILTSEHLNAKHDNAQPKRMSFDTIVLEGMASCFHCGKQRHILSEKNLRVSVRYGNRLKEPNLMINRRELQYNPVLGFLQVYFHCCKMRLVQLIQSHTVVSLVTDNRISSVVGTNNTGLAKQKKKSAKCHTLPSLSYLTPYENGPDKTLLSWSPVAMTHPESLASFPCNLLFFMILFSVRISSSSHFASYQCWTALSTLTFVRCSSTKTLRSLSLVATMSTVIHERKVAYSWQQIVHSASCLETFFDITQSFIGFYKLVKLLYHFLHCISMCTPASCGQSLHC
ncbi:Beta-1,3-galactosyl-O-glycosyl-glycoprotein beta-1,6-N-acetylglucosaminyltransferase [Bulinus truncatus]|nr:Beta-1,3-galactosyl-O-glycosyl-glycoprotein beta-1,6-N-acetylglucosaminyltransferase [Bulinus truncatus]